MYPNLSKDLAKKDVNKSDAVLIARYFYDTKALIDPNNLGI